MTQDLQSRFSRNAELFPHLLNLPTDQIMLSLMIEADYATASFLDQRIVTPQLQRQVVSWPALENISLPKRASPDYIFHIGHVGSTLISRLLGELPEVLALREPHILRDLTEISNIKDLPQSPWSPDMYDHRRDLIIKWLSRGFNDRQRSMIKASSFVSDLAEELIAEDTKCLFLYVPLENYLETILAGDGSRQEAAQLAGTRLVRLNARLEAPIENLWELSSTQKIALGWLCEMTTLFQTYEVKGNGILWQDFNSFLADPVLRLQEIAHHFELNLTNSRASELIAGPIMNSYSKSPDHDYSPDLRRQLLEQARANFGPVINETLDWVKNLSKEHVILEKIINFSERTV